MMRSTLSRALAVAILAAGTATAGFEVPKYVKSCADIEAAKTQAKSAGKGIMLVLTDPAST